jgi:small-conductance mechanosensitive channel
MEQQPINILAELRNNFALMNLVLVAVRLIFIALLFEGLAWWLTRRIEGYIAPLITLDSNREHGWRTRRRTFLRQTPKLVVRTLCYIGAMIAVLSVFESSIRLFSVPVLPVSIVVGALIVIFGVGALSQIQDAVQFYALLADDAVALGDVLEIDSQRGSVQGVVERVSPRGAYLRDSTGRFHYIACREIRHVVIHRRREEARRDGEE